MDEHERKELGKEIIVYLVMILFGGILFGGLATGFVMQAQNKPTSLSGEDKNFLIALTYNGGFCERLGLKSDLIVQNNKDTNKMYGIPICVERQVTTHAE